MNKKQLKVPAGFFLLYFSTDKTEKTQKRKRLEKSKRMNKPLNDF